MLRKLSTKGIKRLEITMRDVLDGLEDAAIFMHYNSTPEVVEILSIEAPGRPILEKQNVINLIPSKTTQNANIVEYLIQRELKRSA